MNASTHSGSSHMAAATQCLVLARQLGEMAITLRAAAAALLEASAQPDPEPAAPRSPGRDRATAVDIYVGGESRHQVRPKLGASNTTTRRSSGETVSVIDRTLEDANDELRAVSHWGAWKPRATRARTTRR